MVCIEEIHCGVHRGDSLFGRPGTPVSRHLSVVGVEMAWRLFAQNAYVGLLGPAAGESLFGVVVESKFSGPG